MGKSSLIIVLGMMLLVSFLVLKLNGNSKENLSTTVDMFNQTQSRLIANTGVEVYLEKLYADHSLMNQTFANQSVFGGTYDVTIAGVLPNVRVTSKSTFQGVKHTSVADAYLTPITFPNPPGGIYISTNSVVNANEIGDMNVNGLDHLADGTLNPTGKPVWGVGVDDAAQRQNILDNLKKPEHIEGVLDTVTGATGHPSVGVTGLGVDWGKMYQFLANAADQTFIQDIPMGTNLGTLSNPKITLINADAATNKTIMINKGVGAGILVVNGDIKFAGNFDYKGIILCYKNSDLSFESTGTNLVNGGIIIAGKNISFKLTGTMNVNHSQEAIDKVRANLKSNGFKILSWYE
jgi:hypothetical protein